MREFRQLIFGVLAALVSAGIILGSLSITLVEGRLYDAINSTPTRYVVLITQPVPTILPSGPGAQTTATFFVAMITPLSLTGTPAPLSPTATPRCQQPEGWSTIVVSLGDTLSSLAVTFSTTEEVLAQANCLDVASVMPGMVLYVPDIYPTEVVAQCGPPPGWDFYTIRLGDTLYELSRLLDVSVAELQFANCLGNSTLIRAGQKMYVPFIPQFPPTYTPQPQPSDTATLMPSATEYSTSTPTQEIPPTPTFTRIPTRQPTRTATPTEFPTEVPTSTPTATDLPTSTATSTPLPTSTSTDTPHPPPPTATPTPTLPVPTSTETQSGP